MLMLLIFFAMFALGGIALAWYVYRRLRRFGRISAGLAALFCLILVALGYPIPIHGGFTTLAEVLWEEFGRQQELWQQQTKNERKETFLHQYEERFAGELSFRPRSEQLGNWLPVITDGEQMAWLDPDHQLIWSKAFPWRSSPDFSLMKPKAFCHQLSPAGYWSLPSTAELVLFWQADGASVTGGPAVNAASFSVDESLLMEIPSIDLGRDGRSHLRCVARAPGAPLRGYLDKDISRELWNRYQLARTSGKLRR